MKKTAAQIADAVLLKEAACAKHTAKKKKDTPAKSASIADRVLEKMSAQTQKQRQRKKEKKKSQQKKHRRGIAAKKHVPLKAETFKAPSPAAAPKSTPKADFIRRTLKGKGKAIGKAGLGIAGVAAAGHHLGKALKGGTEKAAAEDRSRASAIPAEAARGLGQGIGGGASTGAQGGALAGAGLGMFDGAEMGSKALGKAVQGGSMKGKAQAVATMLRLMATGAALGTMGGAMAGGALGAPIGGAAGMLRGAYGGAKNPNEQVDFSGGAQE